MTDPGQHKPGNTVPLAAKVLGDGPPVLMMHGLFGNAKNWHSVQRQVAATYQVHALDLRNHGVSPWHDSMNYRDMAGDVLAYLDAQAIEQAIVLGHSMGGKVAMMLALMAPERISGLIVVDIAPVSYATTLRAYLDAMMATDMSTIESRRDADTALQSAVPDPGIRGFLLQNLVSGHNDNGGSAFRWRLNLAAIDRSLAQLGRFDGVAIEAGRSVQCPVVAIYGTESPYMHDDARDALRDWFTQVQFEPIAQAGHWVHAEQPEAFNRALQSFLVSLQP